MFETNAADILTELGTALKQFGTYSFDDKGAYEVMDIDAIAAQLREMTAANAAKVIIEVARSKKYKGRGLSVAETIVEQLDDWNELFDIGGITDLINGEYNTGA